MTALLSTTALTAVGMFIIMWVVSVAARDASIVDPFWGVSFVVLAWVSFAVGGDPGTRQLLTALLVSMWGLRLSVFLAARNLGRGEDYRYRAMRRRWGRWFPLVSLGTVFILQAALAWIVSLPVQVAMLHSNGLGWISVGGAALWLIGLLFETIGDWQLARFKAGEENAGKVMDRGLWRYTRHPNYFGDFCVWWGLFAVAVSDTSMMWTVVGPIVMSILLLKVSGVALLERTITARRPGYADYAARTSAFIPMPPRRA